VAVAPGVLDPVPVPCALAATMPARSAAAEIAAKRFMRWFLEVSGIIAEATSNQDPNCSSASHFIQATIGARRNVARISQACFSLK
jgi:hypothetical protein